MRYNNNYQSPSNWHVWLYEADPTYGADGVLYPQINGYVEMDYWPIFNVSQGSHFKTQSAFINDTWRVSDNCHAHARPPLRQERRPELGRPGRRRRLAAVAPAGGTVGDQ